MFNFLADSSLVPNWVANSFPVIKFILLIFIAIFSIALIVMVLMQESEGGDSTNSVTGIKDTYYSKNKGYGKAEKLKRATIILSSCIAGLVVIYFILATIYSGNIW